MSVRPEATIEDLYKVDGKAELVNGEIVYMSPNGGLPNFAARQIVLSLCEYEKSTGSGLAVSDNAAFVVNLPNRKSFSPADQKLRVKWLPSGPTTLLQGPL